MAVASFHEGLTLDTRAPFAPRKPIRRMVWLKLSVVAVDTVAIAVGMLLAFVLRDALFEPAGAVDNRNRHLLLGLLSLPLWLILFSHYRLYRTRHIESRLQEFKRVVNAIGAGVLGMAFLATMLRLDVSRGWLLLCFPTSVAPVLAGRELVRRTFRGLRRRGRLMRQVVIVGTNLEADALCNMLEADPSLGYEVVGFVDDDSVRTRRQDDRPVLPSLGDIVAAVRGAGATGALIATTSVELDTANRLARQLTDAGIHVELSSSLRDIAAERLTLRLLGRCPVVYVEPVRRKGWRQLAKRVFDITAAASALVVLSPVLALAAVAIRLDSPGPVLFRQRRVGRNGRLFDVIKLRTMVTGAEQLRPALQDLNEASGPLFKIRNDPRVTRIGKRLRKYSIDELPQLWNVIRGDMSLVGPRPAIPSELEAWEERLYGRVRVRPGLTGMWQVNGRNSATFEDYVRFDLYYVDNWSLWTDIAIVAKTIPVLLSGRGAS